MSTLPGDLDAALQRLSAKKAEWARAPLARRIELLHKLREGTLLVCERWVEAAAQAKGLTREDPRTGEEWLSGPMPFVQNVRLLIEAFSQGGAPKPARLRKRPGTEQWVARVFPSDLQHRLILPGTTAEIWIEPGREPTQGTALKDAKPEGRLCAVLGAGNISAIPAMDALYKLFAEGQVVILKMNPLNEAIGPHLETAFRALIDEGIFAVVYGDASFGAALATHPAVDTLHVTGSDATYEAIVFGADPVERARRKSAGEPLNTRPFTAELGCVTPVILAPGPYSLRDLTYQARHVAAMLTHNGGFNCDAAQVLIIQHEWLQKKTFLGLLRDELRKIPPRHTWATGAAQRREKIVARYPSAEVLSDAVPDTLPWTLVAGLHEGRLAADELLFRTEAFCGAMGVVEISGTEDGPSFLARAVALANDRLWGTLSATLIIHPALVHDHEAAVERAIADLRYGAVCVNAWPGVTFALAAATWGAFPGHTASDIQSGVGVVHNAMLFDHPQKTVVRAPFRSTPPPPYFANLEGIAALGRALTFFEASSPTWGGAIGVARAGMGVKRKKDQR